MTADIGLIGLAVMGQNLILNMNDHGFTVCAFNRTVEKVTHFLENEAKGTNIIGATSYADFASKLKRPRRAMLMVKAGKPVDDFIEILLPHFEPGDIIIDGGNSEYRDTNRRCDYLASKGLHFIGAGVSGGEDGARYGPSIMPGGAPEAWPHVKDIFQTIAAKVDGAPCCDWVGQGGAGHFVKMVHNGIEYGDMQLIAEVYHLMKDLLKLSHDEMADIFARWNKGQLDSFLIDITKDILRFKDAASGDALVTKIRDAAGQKGTGKWTVIAGCEYGSPVTLIGESVFARCLSALKDERVTASSRLAGPTTNSHFKSAEERGAFVDQLADALYAAKIVSYAQGFMLMREAAKEMKWDLNYGGIALMWRGGCIIRSVFLGDIKKAFVKKSDLSSLLLDDFFNAALARSHMSWRRVVGTAVAAGVPTPALSSALAFYDGYRCGTLPANIIQAQRDFFGAHTFERLDNPGTFIHNDWTGHSGNVTSSTYQV